MATSTIKKNMSEVYSTSEIIVGTWTDGSPIYRKVITGLNFGSTANSWTNTGVTIPNINKMLNCRALNISGSDSIQTIMGFKAHGTAIEYYANNTWSGTSTLIVEYTKTS